MAGTEVAVSLRTGDPWGTGSLGYVQRVRVRALTGVQARTT